MDDDSVTSDTPVPTPDESIADDFNADGPGAEDDHDITSELVDKLSAVIDKENGLAIFACGGTAPIVNPGLVDTQPPNDDETPPVVSRSPPVTLRWDAADGKTPCEDTKLTFPLDDTTRNNLENLLKAAAPATFGRGGQDIYDETYRKALKLDPTAFSSTFNPYELGIVDIIAQVLLPSATDSRTCRAVHAELYKLNVYCGPSGKFKPHVDTPRSQYQFGSLVVCLPVEHEGGELQVRHNGKEMTFDWGTAKDDVDHASIRWAAFYSDCEHEVLEVTSGHRVTLTYNLYAVRGNGSLAGYCPALDTTYIPLYHTIDSMLQKEGFMEQGGYLGLFCSHAYAHNSESGNFLPDTLKGVDMVVWETFRNLNLGPAIYPVVIMGRDYWLRQEPRSNERGQWDGWKAEEPKGIVGNSFEVCISQGTVGDTCDDDDILEEWARGAPPVDYKDIVWLTRPNHKELQLFFMTYGNEASVEHEYSYCAIVVRIPPFAARVGQGEQTYCSDLDEGSESLSGEFASCDLSKDVQADANLESSSG